MDCFALLAMTNTLFYKIAIQKSPEFHYKFSFSQHKFRPFFKCVKDSIFVLFIQHKDFKRVASVVAVFAVLGKLVRELPIFAQNLVKYRIHRLLLLKNHFVFKKGGVFCDGFRLV